MALSNYEKQKRWREKNRALYNLQQRQRRTKDKIIGNPEPREQTHEETGKAPGFTPMTKIEQLRQLMEDARAEPVAPVDKPQVFRNDYGAIITESQWERLQKRKTAAKENGYVIDEYSQ